MNNDPAFLSELAAARALGATRYVEGVPRLDRRFGRRGAPAGQSSQEQIVQVTGPATGPVYPGTWYDLIAETLTLQAGGPCWVWPLNGAALREQEFYPGRLWADFTGGGSGGSGSGDGSGSGGGGAVTLPVYSVGAGAAGCGLEDRITRTCPVLDSGGAMIAIKEQHQWWNPATCGYVGKPWCVERQPEDCCKDCSCGATQFLLTSPPGSWSGPFAGWGWPGSAAANCCPGASLPQVVFLTATPAGAASPYNAPGIPCPWNPAGGQYEGTWWITGTPFSSPVPEPLCGEIVAEQSAPGGPGVARVVGTLKCDGSLWSPETANGLVNSNTCTLDDAGGCEPGVNEGPLTVSCSAPFSVSFQCPYPGGVTYTFAASAGSAGGGFNGPLYLGADGAGGWSATADNGASVSATLDGDCLDTITYTAPDGTTAIYEVQMAPDACCNVYTALFVGGTADPADVPSSVTVQGTGCPADEPPGSGGSVPSGGGGSSGGGGCPAGQTTLLCFGGECFNDNLTVNFAAASCPGMNGVNIPVSTPGAPSGWVGSGTLCGTAVTALVGCGGAGPQLHLGNGANNVNIPLTLGAGTMNASISAHTLQTLLGLVCPGCTGTVTITIS